MACWNGLGPGQQERLITVGFLRDDYVPGGDCPNPAEVAVLTRWDRGYGPRFYCRVCAAEYLTRLRGD